MLLEFALPLILAVIMFSLGLGLRPAHFWRIAAEPRAFAIGAFNQLIVVPAAAFAIATLFALPAELALGVMILAGCPGGVLSNSASRYAGGNVPLSISLTAVISLVAAISLPILVALSARHFLGTDAPAINVTALSVQIFLLTAVPVGLGMALTRLTPQFVARAAPRISQIAFWLFLLMILGALIENWSAFASNFWTLGPALIVLNAALLGFGLVSGRLAGLNPKDITTIAIESGTQNGSLGITVGLLVLGASAGLPDTALPAVVYSITAWFLTMPFVLWRRGPAGQTAAAV
ncbi:bile acid:Na+ symporter, BASS family [Pelagibacterium halotolerans]|uniref:Sodium bile acid symporter family protein n=2 Tax=Pelagibacterium TaxID=1082930 RepID=G4R9H3_PELHB|nr:sodium bile acid symporter family protein [Pelagibacterium halotolerans B2]QJR19630.1 bile acid:sodium symporter family protein [Pelagibacterium halotolerans]SDZ86162.1 bile acid:Na+ symporter, BASS family [Pelagibacterium halotolerans]